MTPIPVESAGALLILALTDSLSFGTLLVPVWLLLAPRRVSPRRIVLYLGTVAAAYCAIGVVLMTGGRLVPDHASDVLDSGAFLVGQLVVGVVLLVLSFALDTRSARDAAARRDRRSGRISRWRDRIVDDESPARALVGLALAAVFVEAASMLPYLAATGIITDQASTWTSALLLLAVYCLVMIAPAIVLTVARSTFSGAVEGPLRRLDAWLGRHARSTTIWIIGLAGFFLAAAAIQGLGWIPSGSGD